MSNVIFNEEELKVKVVLPWLTSLGYTSKDLRLEFSFEIRVGKNVFRVSDGRSAEGRASARADILVRTEDGKNLLIIELKNPNERLDADVRDQALSYARLLVGSIAPFCIITNGKDTKLFDSITGDEITAPGDLMQRTSLGIRGTSTHRNKQSTECFAP